MLGAALGAGTPDDLCGSPLLPPEIHPCQPMALLPSSHYHGTISGASDTFQALGLMLCALRPRHM